MASTASSSRSPSMWARSMASMSRWRRGEEGASRAAAGHVSSVDVLGQPIMLGEGRAGVRLGRATAPQSSCSQVRCSCSSCLSAAPRHFAEGLPPIKQRRHQIPPCRFIDVTSDTTMSQVSSITTAPASPSRPTFDTNDTFDTSPKGDNTSGLHRGPEEREEEEEGVLGGGCVLCGMYVPCRMCRTCRLSPRNRGPAPKPNPRHKRHLRQHLRVAGRVRLAMARIR